MARTDAKLHSKGLGGETITTTIGYISPNATNNEIKTFAQMLNGITNNVYDNTDKVTTVNCDTEDDKTTPTINTSMTIPSGAKNSDLEISANYTGNTKVYTYNNTRIKFYFDQSTNKYNVFVPNDISARNYTIDLYAPESTLYNAMETTVTITVE